jgi:hypothetical protein
VTDYQNRLRKLLPDGYFKLNQRGTRDENNRTENQKDDEGRMPGDVQQGQPPGRDKPSGSGEGGCRPQKRTSTKGAQTT